MNTDNNGGPAFLIGSTPEEWGNGMTLRDYFAAKAMQNYICDDYTPDAIAKAAYEMADAMLKARETK